ncbi:hypothetical protein CONLIGDRAFT_581155 [Coniochaeta ligniaria NRRL 30616]|uniref:Cyclin-dependent kinase n=1 Tax=Coniochaeta ligniaria NRRL 30616 TaxID=1408157 RepID=A0A1J7IGI5_9PEZI|nr:hypothetical protein CONLIGDRAFT_581155 [Coniochaeta ligniaria NRRL 30616]
MSSPWKKQPETVADKVLKRAEISKMARRLQNRLALAQFKTKHGWEDLTLDTIEPKIEEEMRRKRILEGDTMSDSSSSASDLPYPSRTLMSSPLKAPFFSDAIGSSNGSTGHRKRTYMASFDQTLSSPSKRFRTSPTAHRSFTTGHTTWKDHHQLAQSSPIKPRRQQHFTTSAGPNVSLFAGAKNLTNSISAPNYAAVSDDDDDLLPAHSFQVSNARGSPPSTPPMRTRSLARRSNNRDTNKNAKADNNPGGVTSNPKTGEEGADLLLYLAASPSPANPPRMSRMDPPSTPPPKTPKTAKLALPSSMMTTPGGGNPFHPHTPGIGFDFSDFVHMTPSPAQKPWKTPLGLSGHKTPMSVARRRLTFDDIP